MSSKPEPKSIVVDVDLVDEDPDNARITFDAAELKILGESLKDRQLAAISVRATKGGRYMLVDGARRLRAAKLAGIKQLRADDWGQLDETQAAVAAATANLEREDLTPYEEARAFDRLVKAKVPKKEICETFGIPFNTLQGRLELLDLPEAVAKRIGDARGSDGTVFGLGHAKALQPIAKHPALLDAALKELDEAKELPTAKDASAHVRDVLYHAKLIVNPFNELPWEARQDKTLAKELAAIPHVTLQDYGRPVDYVIDRPAFNKVKEVWTAKQKGKAAKEQAAAAKLDKAAKADPEAARKQQQRDHLDEQATKLGRMKAKAMMAKVLGERLAKSAELRARLLWRLLMFEVGNDALYGETPGMVRDLAAALKMDEAAAATDATRWIEDGVDDEDADKPAKWFLKAKPEQQAAFVASLACLSEMTASYAAQHGSTKDFFGAKPTEIEARAIREEKERLKADIKAAEKAKPTANSKSAKKPAKGKLAHEEKKKPAGGAGAAGKGPARTRPAPKAKGKAKATKPVKLTPAVAKARATLAKGKQAVLMASPAPAEPPAAPAPAASPRDIADKVLADVLPGLKAVKQAATDHGVAQA